ncbi:Putative transcriptional regulator (fragment) (plasmid) [Cupriavidus taiwanensis]|uniref:Transcriptional regulator n=1 Tax=Cupriavidus taiwanensis TaxID=164546 RepID=A0A7Z7JGQ4_9BURK
MSAKRFKSDAFEAIHSAASGLRKANGIDTKTMREYEDLCLAEPSQLEVKGIVRVRKALTRKTPTERR